MSEKPVDLIRSSNAAFNAGDFEALYALLDPRVEFVDHLPLPDAQQAVRGIEEIRPVLEAWHNGFPGLEAHVEEYVDLGEFVVCATSWHFVSAEKGIELEWRGAEAWQVRDGKIVWGQAGFPDEGAARQAVEARRRAAS
jgi:ketosteroid isomerase-like protein